MPKWLVAVLIVVLQLSWAGPLPACKNPQEQILWLDKSEGEVLFIPEKLLQDKDWSSLPLSAVNRNSLEAALIQPEVLEERRQLFGREENPCWNQGAPNGEGGTYAGAKDLRAWLREFELSVMGRVEHVVPGWDARRAKVAQMVYIRTLDVIRDVSGKKKSGDLLLYLLHYGSIHVKDTMICRDPWKGFKPPAAGDEILLLGHPSRSNQSYLEFVFAFPVEDGKVQYQPHGSVKWFSPLDPKNLH